MNDDGKRRHVEHNVCKSYEQVPTGHHGMKTRGAPILAASGLAGRIDVHLAFHAKSSSSETMMRCLPPDLFCARIGSFGARSPSCGKSCSCPLLAVPLILRGRLAVECCLPLVADWEAALRFRAAC
eukprot:scaffold2979_cov111-Isochrysis_galbana.AAC.2